MEPRRVDRASLGLAAAALLADVAYLRWIWTRFDHWGIWDWDFQLALLEAARKTILDFGELPMWNPWLGGGSPLVGHPLASTYAPSFLPVLVLGTIPGVKIVLLVYTWIAQVGAYRLARATGVGVAPAVLAALVFAWGGAFAQHWTHGHLNWIGYAWVPFVVLAVRRGSVLAAGVYLALSWLDGGPYHYPIVPAFVASCAAAFAIEQRSWRPLVALAPVGALALGLTAFEILPTADEMLHHPRPTEVASDYYGAPFQPTAGLLLRQAFLSRAQAHDPARWQPFFLNVGAYVGILPLLLAAAALALRPRRAWPWALLALGWLAVCLGGTLPPALDPWRLLHALPGFDSVKIPMRFRVLVLLALGLWAAHGLDALGELGWMRRARRVRRIALPALVAIVGLDLALVNGGVFRAAFTVPPIEVAPEPVLQYQTMRRYKRIFRRTVVVPVFPNFPSGGFPAIRANQGLILEFFPKDWPHATIAKSDDAYPGAEVFPVAGASRVLGYERTPNRVTLHVAGDGGTVAVNQNHHPGWRSSLGEVVDHRGLLAVRVPPGEHEVVLRFRPRGFLAGAAISLATAGLALATRRRSRGSGGPGAPRTGASG